MEVMAMTATIIAKHASVIGLKRSLVQTLLSFSFNIGGLLTGALLILYFDVLTSKEAPWTLILYPGILSVRGAIGGLFSGHLSTGLHLGTIRASYAKNTKDFYLLLRAVVTLALMSSITVGLGTSIFGLFLWRATLVDCIKLLAVVTATVALSIVFNSPITIALSFLSFRRGLDPDVIVYPIASTLSDVINTSCYIFSVEIFFASNHFGSYLIGILDLSFLLLVVFILMRNAREEKFAKTIKEFILTLLFVTFIVNVTGSFLNKIRESVGDRREIYVVYPAIITTIGGVGSIIGSTATTKLALGVIKPSFSSIKQHLNEVGGSWLASIVMFALYSIIASFTSGTGTLNDLLKHTVQLVTTNIIAVFAMVIISYSVAVLTHRRGWDPDNFVIPIESSLADSITTISLLVALTLII